jgi:hypothetical protein
MLRRTPQMVALAIDDYLVARDPRQDRQCGAQGVFAVGRRDRCDRRVARGMDAGSVVRLSTEWSHSP